MLDTPERGADESPTREMPRAEPTVESELLQYMDSPESPTLVNVATDQTPDARGRIASKLSEPGAESTAEVSIDDLGLDLSSLEDSGTATSNLESLHETEHPADAATLVAGLDEGARRMLAEAESRSRERDMTALERELEASFISELDASDDDLKTGAGPESAPTVMMPRDLDMGATTRLGKTSFAQDLEHVDPETTSKLRDLNVASIDLDLDRLATALGNGDDTMEQPHASEDLFSSEVFEPSARGRRIDLDVGDDMDGAVGPTVTARMAQNGSGRVLEEAPDFEPVTMSEVGTKLDLARAYMDMGDPEGARNILDEVVQEGSASQKQEAQRLIQSLPG